MKSQIEQIFLESIAVKSKTLQINIKTIERAAKLLQRSLKAKGKILLCGNGGSAADCQHIAAEFVGRFKKERKALPALALTTDTSALTCIANDYGYKDIFSRQIEGLGVKKDVLIAISTSGNSVNVLEAVKKAKRLGIKTIGLTGNRGGKLGKLCAIHINVPSSNTARIQESHICIGHILCELAEKGFR